MTTEKEKEIVFCRRCGRRLKNPISIEKQIGKICLEKEELEKNKEHKLANRLF